jgi:hypothetical protein
MAPEQVSRSVGPLSAATDVWAVGVCSVRCSEVSGRSQLMVSWGRAAAAPHGRSAAAGRARSRSTRRRGRGGNAGNRSRSCGAVSDGQSVRRGARAGHGASAGSRGDRRDRDSCASDPACGCYAGQYRWRASSRRTAAEVAIQAGAPRRTRSAPLGNSLQINETRSQTDGLKAYTMG